jgi:hypothetical protein
VNLALKTNSSEYQRVHYEWGRVYGEPSNYICEFCDNDAKVKGWIHGKDPHNINSYVPMCRSCHNKYDCVHFGEKHHNVKLTEAKVLEIRRLYSVNYPYITYVELGRLFDVHHETIGKIIRRERWARI